MLSFYDRGQKRVSYETTRLARFLKAWRGRICFDYNGDYTKTVLVVGSGRSGTTWLGEIINARNEFRDIFEPFHPFNVKLCRGLPMLPYLRPSDDNSWYLKLAETILTGRMHSNWSDQYNRRFACERRLVKDIRLNLLLGWMRIHFPAMPIVYVLRHPCAVALSRLQLGSDGAKLINRFLSRPQLVDDYLKPFLPVMAEPMSAFEYHVLAWCVENYVPLSQLHKGDALVVFYENLCTRPELETSRLAHFLDLNAEAMARRIGTPSSQVNKKYSAVMLGHGLASAWKKRLSTEMERQALSLLKLFGLTSLYTEDPQPRLASDDVFEKWSATKVVSS